MTRTVNVVVTFLDPDAVPDPMGSDYSISSHGYNDGDLYAPPRLGESITYEKSIGSVFWKEKSGLNFGNIDIDITDGGLDVINGTEIDWISWALNNNNPQVTIAVEQQDGTLLHVATADGTDVSFPDDRTIRVALEAKHGKALDQFINDYVPDDTTFDEDVQNLPVPVFVGAGAVNESSSYDPSTFQPRTHVKALQVDSTLLRYMVTTEPVLPSSPSPYFVLDRGAILREGENPGFTLWENGFELTDNPDGEITFAWVSDEFGGIEDPFETGELVQGPFSICRWVIDRVGIDVASYYPSFGSFPDLFPAGLEKRDIPTVQYPSEVTARQALDDVIMPMTGWWFVDEFGMFKFGKLVAPEDESPNIAYDDDMTIGDISSRVDRAPGLSAFCEFGYSSGAFDIGNMAGSVGQSRKQRLSRQWLRRETTAQIPEIYSSARGTEPMRIYTADSFTARVQAEFDRRWTTYYPGIRRFYTFTIPLWGSDPLPELGDVISLQSNRARLYETPISMVVKAMRYDLGRGLVRLTCWGGPVASDCCLPDFLGGPTTEEIYNIDVLALYGDDFGSDPESEAIIRVNSNGFLESWTDFTSGSTSSSPVKQDEWQWLTCGNPEAYEVRYTNYSENDGSPTFTAPAAEDVWISIPATGSLDFVCTAPGFSATNVTFDLEIRLKADPDNCFASGYVRLENGWDVG